MPGIHQTLATIILVVGSITLIVGSVNLVLSRRTTDATSGSFALSSRILRIALWTTEGIAVLQALAGLLLVQQGNHPREGLHFVYGIIVFGAIPVAYVYSDQKDARRDAIIMFFAILAVVGATIRAFATGS